MDWKILIFYHYFYVLFKPYLYILEIFLLRNIDGIIIKLFFFLGQLLIFGKNLISLLKINKFRF